jgi:hypothetical protein
VRRTPGAGLLPASASYGCRVITLTRRSTGTPDRWRSGSPANSDLSPGWSRSTPRCSELTSNGAAPEIRVRPLGGMTL